MESGIDAGMKPILLISASDSSGAAGMQVDIRVAQELDCPVRCAVSALTVQGDKGVMRVDPVDPDSLGLAIRTAMEDDPGIAGIKIGLVPDAAAMRSIGAVLSDSVGRIPIVVDPVIRSTSGTTLADDTVVEAILEQIIPTATLLTPNGFELAALAERQGVDSSDTGDQVKAVLVGGAKAVLLTGGDSETDTCEDLLFVYGSEKWGSEKAGGEKGEDELETIRFSHPRIPGQTPRGTGCALSTAITVFLAQGLELETATARGIEYVAGKIEASRTVGRQRLLFS